VILTFVVEIFKKKISSQARQFFGTKNASKQAKRVSGF
jgi:hypothetical protein